MTALDPSRLEAVRARLGGDRAALGGAFSVAQALDAGLTEAQVRTLVRRQVWVSVRHGWLAEGALRGPVAAHRLACVAEVLAHGGAPVVSHVSAWVLHGFGLLDPPPRPTLTLPYGPDVAARRGVRVARLPDADVVSRQPLRLTAPARTAVDVLRGARDDLVAQELADVAARSVDGTAVEAVLAACRRWPGSARAARAWQHADPRMESPLESRCRVWFRAGGLPEPEPQVVVRGWSGELVGRVDFLFRAERTVVEADGRLKYDDPSALWQEKLREDRLRDLGFEVVRATWADGDDGGAALVARVRRAFARTARRTA